MRSRSRPVAATSSASQRLNLRVVHGAGGADRDAADIVVMFVLVLVEEGRIEREQVLEIESADVEHLLERDPRNRGSR